MMWSWQSLSSRLGRSIGVLVLVGGVVLPFPALAEKFILYAGSYTAGTSKGIYAWRFDSRDGSLDPLGLEAATPQPAYVTVSRNQRFLYAVNWEDSGGVSAFRIDAVTGALTFLNRVSADGSKPNQVLVHPGGRIAVAVNYTTGNVVAYKVQPDGTLTEAFWTDQHAGQPASPKQQGPKAHGIVFSRDEGLEIGCRAAMTWTRGLRLGAGHGLVFERVVLDT